MFDVLESNPNVIVKSNKNICLFRQNL